MSAERIGRMTILAVTFLFLFSFITGLMPSALKGTWTPSSNQPTVESLPSYITGSGTWLSENIISSNFSYHALYMIDPIWNTSVTYHLTSDLQVNVGWFRTITGNMDEIIISHLYGYWLWVIPQYHDCNPIITRQILLDNALSMDKNISEVIVHCACPKTFYCIFGFDRTKWHSLADAWDNGAFYLLIGVSYTDAFQVGSLFSLMGQILFFSNPNINYVVNVIVAIPLWIMITYLAYRFLIAVFHGF